MKIIQTNSFPRVATVALSLTACTLLSACAISDLQADDTFKPVAMSARYPIHAVDDRAVVRTCGDWSTNLAETATNEPPDNMGCAVQTNIAAMIAHPQDIRGKRRLARPNGELARTAVAKILKPCEC